MVRRSLSYPSYIDRRSHMLKRHLLVVIAIVALGLAACSSGDDSAADDTTATSTDGGFMVQDGDLVEVHYSGTLDDGSTFDSSRERGAPFSFTVGTGQVIPGFDDAVRGLAIGESTTIRMLPTEAYGEWREDLVVEVPYGPSQGDVAVGDEVFLNTGQPAIVLEVKEGAVVLDTNPTLAGEALTFEIEVLAITRPQ
jgi:FKBP-type peptidyl-prolyl cis-trans isomerase 2